MSEDKAALDIEAIRKRLLAPLDMGEEAIEPMHELLLEEALPARACHLLACAAARRALSRERDAGVTLDQALWQAIEAKQAWVAGDCDESTLQQAAAKARQAAHAASIKGVGHEAACAAADASSELFYSMRAAAWALAAAGFSVNSEERNATRLEESRWQVEQLLQLLTSSPS